MKMIRQEDYPCEKHTVQTEDGYILTLHRIPQQNATQSQQKVILLMHGMYFMLLSVRQQFMKLTFLFKVFRIVHKLFWTTIDKSLLHTN